MDPSCPDGSPRPTEKLTVFEILYQIAKHSENLAELDRWREKMEQALQEPNPNDAERRAWHAKLMEAIRETEQAIDRLFGTTPGY